MTGRLSGRRDEGKEGEMEGRRWEGRRWDWEAKDRCLLREAQQAFA